MKKILSVLSIIFVFLTVLCVMSSCSSVPDIELTSGTEIISMVNPAGNSQKNGENGESVISETISDVEFNLISYYEYEGSYAIIDKIYTDESSLSSSCEFYADINIYHKGLGADYFLVAYKAYDAEGNVTRENFIRVGLDEIKSGDTVMKCRFDVPYDSVKVEFSNYSTEK